MATSFETLRFRSLVALLIAGVSLTASTSAQITLDADFDHGSLNEANSSVRGTSVTLAGRDNFNHGEWKWLYFSAAGIGGTQAAFRITDNFAGSDSNLDGHAMVFSYDQQTWFFFDNNDRNAAEDTFTFFNDTRFTEDLVYVAYGLPYPDQRVIEQTARLTSSPWVSPTTSADSNLVIGQSPGGVDDLGRSIAPRDIFGYRITDPSAAGPKVKVGLLGGVHANETLGNFALEGLVDFLVSDDLTAGILRKYAEFYVYPMANPDGRFAGYNRSTVQNEPLDPNRFWESPDYGGLDDIRIVGDALLADTGGNVDYFVDFHSTVVGKDAHFAYVLPASQNDSFWLGFLQLEPSVETRDAQFVDLSAAKFGRDELDADFCITFETQFIPGENIDRFHALGENLGLALQQVLTTPADLNFDGMLDGEDWLILIGSAETELAGLSPVEAYAHGDLDGDGRNSVIDFGLFKGAYEAVHGAGSFAQLTVMVPEANAFFLMVVGTTVAAVVCPLRLARASVRACLERTLEN